MFQQRNVAEIQPLVEISFVTLTPGALSNTTTTAVAGACTLGAPASGSPATFAIGDELTVYPASTAGTNGVAVTAFPTATAGTAEFYFTNFTGSPVTPVASSVYKVVATRFPANLTV